MLADVVKLMQHHRTLRLAGLGDLAEAINHRVVVMAEITPRQPRRRMDRHGLDHDHRSAAACPLQIIAQMARARQPVLRHIRRMRSKIHPVFQRLVANFQRFEQLWIRLIQHGYRGFQGYFNPSSMTASRMFDIVSMEHFS